MASVQEYSPESSGGAGIIEAIRNHIASGKLPMGARIPHREIAAVLGVSGTQVCQALSQLQTEGLVEIRPQSGAFVFDMSVLEMRQLCAARMALEAGAIRATRTAASVRLLRALVDRAEDALHAGELSRCCDLDSDFHEALVAASGNVYMIRCYRGISDRLRALRQLLPRERIGIAIAKHRQIIDLLAAAEPAQAAKALEEHIGNVERSLTVAGSARAQQD